MEKAPCVFIDTGMVVMCYVDDILIVGSKQRKIDELIYRVSRNLKTKDLGRLSHFLGIELLWNEGNGLFLRQSKLVNSLLESTGMASCNGIESPLNPVVDLSLKEGEIVEFKYDYRSVIGSLLYLSIKTRPDIDVAVSMLSQHVENPTKIQSPGIKRLLQYLKKTANAALRVVPKNRTQLKAWVDAS